MGKTLGIDRETARRIKRMSRQELDGYLSRVTDRSYDNGYEEGLVNGIALAGQALDTVLKKYEADGALTALAVEEITKAVDLMLDQEANQIVRLKDVLDQVEEQYDYCLIDCPPGVGINVLNALAAADDVIIPIKADKNALDGMEELTEVIEEIRPYNPGLSLVKCLVTMFTNDISVVKGEEALRKSEYSTFNTHIRYSKKVVDWTYEKRKSLIETTPRSAATRDYKSLAAEYIRLTRKEG